MPRVWTDIPPLMLWDNKSLFGLKKCPRIAPNWRPLLAGERGGPLCRNPPLMPSRWGPPPTRLLSGVHPRIQRHWGLCISRPGKRAFGRILIIRDGTSLPFASKDLLLPVRGGTAPAVPPASPKCPHPHPCHLIREEGAGSDVCPELLSSSDLISSLMEDLHSRYRKSFSPCEASHKLSQLFSWGHWTPGREMISNLKAYEDALKAEQESRRTTLCDFVMEGSRRHHGELCFKKVCQH